MSQTEKEAFDLFVKKNPYAILIGSRSLQAHGFPLRRDPVDFDFYINYGSVLEVPEGFEQPKELDDYYESEEQNFNRFDLVFNKIKFNVFVCTDVSFNKSPQMRDRKLVNSIQDTLEWKMIYSKKTKKHFEDMKHILEYLIICHEEN